MLEISNTKVMFELEKLSGTVLLFKTTKCGWQLSLAQQCMYSLIQPLALIHDCNCNILNGDAQ